MASGESAIADILDIHWALWRWAKRRHKEKSTRWIRQRYFDDEEAARNRFHTHWVNADGSKVTIRIYEAAKVSIQRHIKVRANSNPYDPTMERYFEQRQSERGVSDL